MEEVAHLTNQLLPKEEWSQFASMVDGDGVPYYVWKSSTLAPELLSVVYNTCHQGRSLHLVSQHPSSSHWISEGSFILFANYQFVIKGRLNLLPTKIVIKRARKLH